MDKMNIERNTLSEFAKYQDSLSLGNKLHRLAWNIVYCILFRPFGLPVFNGWRSFLLRFFGAKIGHGSIVHSSARIWAPWNLEVGMRTCVGPNATIYNPGKIILGNKVAISQNAHLCAASHDYESSAHQLICRPVIVHDRAWVAADAFVSLGVTIGEGAVVGARAAVFKDVEPWTVVGGNPAKVLKNRVISED